MRFPIRFSAVALASLALSAAATAQTIDTRPGGTIGTQGGGSGTWGEVFATPTGYSVLDDFSFWTYSNNFYKAYVYEWNGTQATGSALYTSSDMTTLPGPTEVTFATGGVDLDPTKMYVAFLRNDTGQGSGLGVVYDGNYEATGQIVQGPGAGASGTVDPTSAAWSAQADNTDAEFVADFSAPTNVTTTPEPATLALLVTGLIPMAGGLAWRRTRCT